jgi:flagellar biosynthesis chaperone FliJ
MEIREVTGKGRKILSPIEELQRLYRLTSKKLDGWESQLRENPSSFRKVERQVNEFIEKKRSISSPRWFNRAASRKKSQLASSTSATTATARIRRLPSLESSRS